MMKKILLSSLLLAASSSVLAVAPGGPTCGWGNIVMEGKSGLVNHFLAATTNGTSGNATFGMTFGTVGCSVDGPLTSGGTFIGWFDNILEEYSTDVAQGSGEALQAVAVMMGIDKQDRAHFDQLMHDNFATLFPNQNVTSQEVIDSMVVVMESDQKMAKYIG